MKKWHTGSGKGSEDAKTGDGALLKDLLKKTGANPKDGHDADKAGEE